jgi:hypothetical protein
MSSSGTYAIYVVNFNDDERKQRMSQRFAKNGLYAHFVPPVTTADPRISAYEITDFQKRSWAILFQHLDSCRHFYENTSADYAIVCEDDIYISNQLKERMPEIIAGFQKNNLDFLQLGYLWPYPTVEGPYFPEIGKTENHTFHRYPNDLWGAHMYMFSRSHVAEMLAKFTPEYAFSCTNTESPFCSDWQITKFGNRALISPVLGVEEGEVKTDHQGQIDYHRQCSAAHYKSELFY